MFAPLVLSLFFFFSSRRRHTRYIGDWSSDVCSSDLRELGDDGSPARGAANRGRSPGTLDRILLRALGTQAALGRQLRRADRSEERRVGKEGRSRWAADNT